MKQDSHYLITGGTGFFGVSLLRYIQTNATNRPSLTILSRDPTKFRQRYPDIIESVDWIRGDVLDPKSLPKTRKFSHVIHAAADSTLGQRLTPMERYDQIVMGTKNVLDMAVAVGAKRFLLTSTGGVYGPQPNTLVTIPEDYCGMPDPLNPYNAYSVAKRLSEHLCALYKDKYGIETVIARCFSFVGRDLPLNVHFAIGNFIRDALWRDEITVSGDGLAVRSYLDQTDLAVWLITILENGRSGYAYNVGSDKSIEIAQLARLVRDIISPLKQIVIRGKQSETELCRLRYVPNITRARQELGLKVTVPLEEAIRISALTNR